MGYETLSKEELLELIASLEQKMQSMHAANEELISQMQRKDSELLRMQRDLQGRIAEAIWHENDVKRNQERFRTLVSNIPGAVYRCANDAYWTMEYLSDQIEHLCGYPATDFINNTVRSYKSIVHPEDVIKVVNSIRDATEARRPYSMMYRIKHKDGNILRVYERGVGVFAPEGTLLWLDGVIFDTNMSNSYGTL